MTGVAADPADLVGAAEATDATDATDPADATARLTGGDAQRPAETPRWTPLCASAGRTPPTAMIISVISTNCRR